MSEREEQLYHTLDVLGVAYEKYEHPAFASCDESGSYYEERLMGVDCRNSFLRNRRGKKHYLVVMPRAKQIDIAHLADFLNENKKMGFASEERLLEYLGLTPGSVTPFAITHENAKDVALVIDRMIFDHEHVHFHPLRNTASLKITTEDFKKFLDALDRTVLYYDSNDA